MKKNSEPKLSVLGENLKRLRGELSQAAFARMLGVKQPTYANYESGTREPDVSTLVRISAVCGKSIDELVGRKEYREGETVKSKVEDLKKAIITLLKQY